MVGAEGALFGQTSPHRALGIRVDGYQLASGVFAYFHRTSIHAATGQKQQQEAGEANEGSHPGRRLRNTAERTHFCSPKPLVEIGGRPILWHIMRHYSHHGLNEFVICCGYKGSVIKDYFLNYMSHQGDFTIHLQRNRIETHRKRK